MKSATVIAFDADDTLWVNEPIFTNTRLEFEKLLSKYVSIDKLEEELYGTERRNLTLFGYGVKGFTLSMIETAIELTKEKVTGADIQLIIDMAKEMLAHPVHLLPGVKDTVKVLKEEYQIMIITKGDLFDQENKIARSGIAQHFKWIEIVSEKNEVSYQDIINRYGIDASSFLMVGNSLKSDVIPVCNLGAQAVHIPFHDTWQHEEIPTEDHSEVNFHSLQSITGLVDFLAQN